MQVFLAQEDPHQPPPKKESKTEGEGGDVDIWAVPKEAVGCHGKQLVLQNQVEQPAAAGVREMRGVAELLQDLHEECKSLAASEQVRRSRGVWKADR